MVLAAEFVFLGADFDGETDAFEFEVADEEPMVLDDELGEGELAGADGGEVGEEVAAEMEIVLVGFVREDGEIGGTEAVLHRVLGGDGLARLGLLAPAEAAVEAAGFHTPGILFGYSRIGTRLIFHAFRLGGAGVGTYGCGVEVVEGVGEIKLGFL